MQAETKYKLGISCKALYKEVELQNSTEKITIGTQTACEVRLRKELFFGTFALTVYRHEDNWEIKCSEEVYLAGDETQKLFVAALELGKEYQVKYRETDNTLLFLSFLPSFEPETQEFTALIKNCGFEKFRIGSKRFQSEITIHSSYSEQEYVALMPVSEGLKITELKSLYGIFLNGVKAKAGEVIHEKDFLSLAELTFYYSEKSLFVNAKKRVTTDKFKLEMVGRQSSVFPYPLFNRSTRLKILPAKEAIQVLDPPAVPQKPKGNAAMQLLPALAMIAITVVVRGFMSSSSNMSFVIFSICSMTIGVITSLISIITSRKEYKQSIKEREENYQAYIEEKKKEIEQARKEEKQVLNEIFREPEAEIHIVEQFDGKLFDRVPEDEDFLCTRVGTGERLAERVITYKKQEKFATDDKLAAIPEELEKTYRFVHNAPVTLNLAKDGAVGIVGQKNAVYELLKPFLLDIIVRQYYEDVELVLLIPEEEREKYNWARWIPHFFNERLRIRNIVWNEESKNIIFEYLYTEIGKRKKKEKNDRHIIVISVKDWGLNRHPLSKYVKEAADLEVTFVFCESSQELLPTGADEILFVNPDQSGSLVNSGNRLDVQPMKFPLISDAKMEQISRKLAPVHCEKISLENSLTSNITLYELLGIYSASDLDFAERWRASDIVRSMAVPLGVKTKEQVVSLDLHEKFHGPHGLVAGTTGSGKSELLQTYILSAATLFHPYEIGFVIIDFKGGGMVNQFRNLPHLIGAITNIDGREINRSLLSIKAELQKRQRLFADYNVNNINAYMKLFKSGKTAVPMPHLILIVDEFAELKAEQPEFMKELISASRIGRSLGVHLILATQKPSGQVSEQIWSNSKFKLCLKVQTKEDSNEVLHSPLAAEIVEPGRAYIQVGNNELFELFQSAYSGADVNAGFADDKQDFSIFAVGFGGVRRLIYRQSGKKSGNAETTQLDAIVEAIAAHCTEQKIKPLTAICLPPLPEVIPYDGGKETDDREGLKIPIGIYDDPANQFQGTVSLNLTSDNLLIIGASQMGKTNLLQVILRTVGEKYAPSQMQLYIMDFASMTLKTFEKLHHVGGVVIPGENEKLKNLFKLLRTSVEERKSRLLETGVSSFYAYLEAGYEDLPRVLVMMDNFSVFKELYEETYESDFQFLTREGPTYGISFIITNVRTAGFGYRYMANFGCRVSFTCNEAAEYGNVFERCRMEPKNVPGRIICKAEHEFYEAHTYLAFEGEREVDRTNHIRAFVQKANALYPDEYAKKIPEVPAVLSLAYLEENYKLSRGKAYLYPVGLDYASVEVVWFDFNRMIDLCILAKEPAARMSALNSLLKSIHYYALDWPVQMYIVDSYERNLKKWSEISYVERYTIDCHGLDDMLEECQEELEERQNLLRIEDLDELSRRPFLLYVIHNEDAIEYISGSKTLNEGYQKISRMGKMLKVMFLFSNIEDTAAGYNSPALLKKLKENKRVLAVEKLADIKFFDIPISVARSMKGFAPGDSYYINGNDILRMKLLDN